MAARARSGTGPRREARLPLALRRIDGNLAFGRGGVGRLLGGRTRGPGRERIERDAALVAETVAGAGLFARPAEAAELEWLLHRSLGLGLPAPGALSPVRDGTWESEDLFEISDSV